MSSNPKDFFSGLAATIANVDADVYEFWRDAVNPPCIVTYMGQMPRDYTQPTEFVSVVLVGMTDEESGQSQCYDIAAAAAQAVDIDQSLGGSVSSAWCKAFRNSRPWPVQDGRQRMWSLEVVWDVFLAP